MLVGRANGSVSLYDASISRAIVHLEPPAAAHSVVALVWHGPWRLGCFACLRADGSLVLYDICKPAFSAAPPTVLLAPPADRSCKVVHCTGVDIDQNQRGLALLMHSGEVVVRREKAGGEREEEATR